MTKCLKSDLYRLIRGRAFYVYTGLILILSVLTAFMHVPTFELCEAEADGMTVTVLSYKAVEDYGEIGYWTAPSEEQIREDKTKIFLERFEAIPRYAAFYTALFVIITEFLSEKHKTMKNKVSAGIPRIGICLSKFIFAFLVYIFTYLIHALATTVFILSRKEDILVKAGYLNDSVFNLIIAGLLVVSVTVLFIGIFYCIGPYAVVAVALGFIVASMGLTNIAESRLGEPKQIETRNEEGVVISVEDNPRYPSGIERSIYQGIIDYDPTSIIVSDKAQFVEDPDEFRHIRETQTRSAVLWFVIYNALSVLCFKKMERL